jgi:hypothetical protein
LHQQKMMSQTNTTKLDVLKHYNSNNVHGWLGY